MTKKQKVITILILTLFATLFPSVSFAQRRNHGTDGRRRYKVKEVLDFTEMDGIVKGEKIRTYDITLDFGLGNFVYEEHSTSGASGAQALFSGDMFSLKTSVVITETEGTWSIDVAGEIIGTTNRLERWWSKQKLFRVNRLFVKGLCMETVIRYSFEEMGLFPFQILARPNISSALVYRFYGLRREKGVNLIDNEIKIPRQADFALFGIEPGMGLNFTMADGTINGYVNLETGIYGASVEKNYIEKRASTPPYKTYARSILARIGLKGEREKIFYHLGYSIYKLKIVSRKSIPESRIDQNRIICNLGIRF